jgi:hypothetical protein
MKSNLFLAALGVAIIAVTGCSSSVPYDPSIKRTFNTNDKIAVTSISTVPSQPVAHQTWNTTMRIRNLSKETLHNVSYEFVYDGGFKRMGAGTIPKIGPGQTVEVVSDPGNRIEQGFYRLEGRVFLQNPKSEKEYIDRVDNWKDLAVTVAQ